MSTSPLSRYLLGGALGALIASGLFDGPLSLVSAAQYFQPSAIVPITTVVDRSAKGDRLPQRPDAGTTTINRDGGTSARETGDPKLVPASLEDCEPVASPYADPKLGKFAGRCFV
jgi:hypothetical protein